MEIKLENLRKVFGEKVAVDVDNFTIHSGDILGLVGNNGAGKSTLFRLLLDLLEADGGHATYAGYMNINGEETPIEIDPAKSENWKQFVGAYVDDGFLIDFLTPEEYFTFVGNVSKLSKDDVNAVLEKYKAFMAEEILDQKKLIRDFSAGNKQKIGIIAAMISKPQVLILDEPFNFLDPSSQHMLKQILSDYAAETGATLLISSHNLQHTVDISTRIALLEHGHIIKDLDNTDHSAEQLLEEYFNV